MRKKMSQQSLDDEDDPYEEEEEYYPQEPRPNTGVVILLTVLIAVLLLAAGFLFVRYFLPNMGGKEPTIPVTEPVVTQAETQSLTVPCEGMTMLLAAGFLFVRYFLPNMGGKEPTIPVTEPVVTQAETQSLTVPCEGMTMTSARQAVLNQEGGKFLIHVTTTPSNTTDEIVFTSSDESVATVTADGRVEAVAEGQAVIHVTCGQWSMDVNVTVKFEQDTVPPTVAATEATEATEAADPTAETKAPAEGETQPTEAPAATEEASNSGNTGLKDVKLKLKQTDFRLGVYYEHQLTEEASNSGNTGLKDVKLKLKQTDFRLGVYYEHQLKLDCALEQNEVEWSSEHPYIATVDENGVVKAIKSGTTSITAKYGDQEVSCIVRCF